MMKKLLPLSILFLVTLLLTGCGSAKKSLKKGNYDDSVFRSVEKLSSNPQHTSSADILKVAYPAALEQHLRQINLAHTSTNPFRFEDELKSYESLNALSRAVSSCSACIIIVTPRDFQKDEDKVRETAATTRYNEAELLLAEGDRMKARTAYQHFEKADFLIPGFRDVKERLKQAYHIASFKVVVEQVLVTSRTYKLSNEYFQNAIDQFLQTSPQLNKFVRFYTPDEATQIGLQPDHVITLKFDDFVVGQTLIEKNTETFTGTDSVKVAEKTVGRIKIPIYEKVTAKFTHTQKMVHSSGLLDMQIREFKSHRIVTQDKFNGEYNWMCEWASFIGDERALTYGQLRMTKSKELAPPPPQELFIEFSKPIYDRVTSKLRSFYAKY